MVKRQEVETEIVRLTNELLQKQDPDGAWRFCFECGPLTDALLIFVLIALDRHKQAAIGDAAARLAQLQQPDGTWRLYEDEREGNLSATVLAYTALRASEAIPANDLRMHAAAAFIRSRGGVGKSDLLTRIVLSIVGRLPWRNHFVVPVEVMLLPDEAPLTFYDFAGIARVHIAPALILANKRYQIASLKHAVLLPDENGENRSVENDYRFIAEWVKKAAERLLHLPGAVHEAAIRRAERFMLDRVEPDGTLYSYASATTLMIFALLALGYDKHDPIFDNAVKGLLRMRCHTAKGIHLQNATSIVWDTALLSHALQIGGKADPSAIAKTLSYLLSRQHTKQGDWRLRNPAAPAGGWGFSDVNTLNPDVDDTTAALRAIGPYRHSRASCLGAWNRGLAWVLSMQNEDGGWPAFERNTDSRLLAHLPVEHAEVAALDPSTSDLTGRTLEFLGRHTGLNRRLTLFRRGAEWLLRQQEEDGSWYGRWGICYLYGTWAAITGLAASGMPADHPAMRKAVRFLRAAQNPDGGWGESCRSDLERTFVPLGASTPSQTAWALDALMAAGETGSAVRRGVLYLIAASAHSDRWLTYPTGAGLPGSFYVHYHSYNYVWPLIALGRYAQLVNDNATD